MASYKQPCKHCGAFINRDALFCPKCGSRSPFVDSCPTCLYQVNRGDVLCAGCGRPLYITCSKCEKRTFVQDKCEHCGHDFMVQCPNKRCGSMQFFENKKCTACGKSLKKE